MDSDATEPNPLGQRIRELRQSRRLPMSRVAKDAGVSVSFLSQLERGKSNASLNSLRAIASALSVTLADLFDQDKSSAPGVLRAADRPVLRSMNGPVKYLVTRPPLRAVEVTVGEFAPGTSTGTKPYTHGDSQEIFMVISGRMLFEVDGVEYILEGGDSMEFYSSQAHRAENLGSTTAQVIWVVSPPTPPDVIQD
ncbi:cupin domain-containing protein [Micromonospora sp. NBC_01655]|uniref:helix-turn-helix domain-containing protein n=1 Tax=Micromonospora sp. NBC_01655 TaxID=2975983 RepID=UPI002110B759|nr:MULTISPECIES: cupin domain-containing protein [unclassified Micromonospora]MCX4471911.1 cupin domain-containing protein [Micromonospora sp. NBC_01655]